MPDPLLPTVSHLCATLGALTRAVDFLGDDVEVVASLRGDSATVEIHLPVRLSPEQREDLYGVLSILGGKGRLHGADLVIVEPRVIEAHASHVAVAK
jgi:hypothetical protein